jgi:metal-responsive CopG/Arc/MetJ family transcriptional regulator
MQKKANRRGTKTQNASWVRASISFPADIHQTLEDIAKQKKVSLAWVVRDAAEKYVAEQRRLLRNSRGWM